MGDILDPSHRTSTTSTTCAMNIIALVVLCVGVVAARPQGVAAPITPIPIIMDERLPIDTLGGYGFRNQTGNGIACQETAAATGPLNQVAKTGQYTFTHPDGTPHTLTYTADANGYRPVS